MEMSDDTPNTPLITTIINTELDGDLVDKTPTVPSLLWPGTEEALRRRCSCPVEENLKRLRTGERPKLLPSCRVHNKICQAAECGCDGERNDHSGTHFRCQHCTNVLHQCVVCHKIYLEDGDDPTLFGWLLVENDPIVKGWRCRTCR